MTNMILGRRRRDTEQQGEVAQSIEVGQLIGQLSLYAQRLQTVVERAENLLEQRDVKGVANDGPHPG